MRPRYLIVVTAAALGAFALAAPARAEPGRVLVPMDHGIGWNAYPPFWMSPSYRTCRKVSTPSSGWMCSFEKPPFIAKPYDDEAQAVRAKPAKKKQAQKVRAKKGAYAAKPKAAKQSAKSLKRASPG